MAKITIVILSVLCILGASKAYASCSFCNPADCAVIPVPLNINHYNAELQGNLQIDARFPMYRAWVFDNFWQDLLLVAMMEMTEQLSAIGMYQMFAVGTMIDAKVQLETQRLFDELEVQAVKDYQPSEDFCAFGTTARSLASANSKSDFNAQALNSITMARHTGVFDNAAASSNVLDKVARWDVFINTYCSPYNNAHDPRTTPNLAATTGLVPVCSATNKARMNADVNYVRTIEEQRTINADFTNTALPSDYTVQEQDVLELSKYLYGHNVLRRDVSNLDGIGGAYKYLDLRSVTARRNVAQNSYNNIAAMKFEHNDAQAPHIYIRALLRNLGLDPTNAYEFEALLGENPSYYAQLEALSKRIYQDQSFYANLYDKPVNVARTQAAMRAVDLMVGREMFESRIRQEMLISVLLSTKLEKYHARTNDILVDAINGARE